ncbi:MAG: DUF488 domain-containing protein [Dehalogenimonas sp.]
MTIGHSTRTLESFISTLKSYGADVVVDIRTIPRSRHNPRFNQETLPDSLKTEGLEYVHLTGLGGLRHASPDSINTGWSNASFRGFADYMQTGPFTEALNQLIEITNRKLPVLMCAEMLPWRCHRSLIADALVIRGSAVEHILSDSKWLQHKLTPWASVHETFITYPASNP